MADVQEAWAGRMRWVGAWVVRAWRVQVAGEAEGFGLERVLDSWQPGGAVGGTRSTGQERLGQEAGYLERWAPSANVRVGTTGRLDRRLCRPL